MERERGCHGDGTTVVSGHIDIDEQRVSRGHVYKNMSLLNELTLKGDLCCVVQLSEIHRLFLYSWAC